LPSIAHLFFPILWLCLLCLGGVISFLLFTFLFGPLGIFSSYFCDLVFALSSWIFLGLGILLCFLGLGFFLGCWLVGPPPLPIVMVLYWFTGALDWFFVLTQKGISI
jgi:hypothetical protein